MTFQKSLVWFRRDLRDFDHAALHHALTASKTVYCAFVYDDAILSNLPRHDRRVAFIHASIAELDAALRGLGGALTALEVFRDDFVQIIDAIEVNVVQLADFGLDITGNSDIHHKNRLVLAQL